MKSVAENMTNKKRQRKTEVLNTGYLFFYI